jgi:hypothetical protein
VAAELVVQQHLLEPMVEEAPSQDLFLLLAAVEAGHIRPAVRQLLAVLVAEPEIVLRPHRSLVQKAQPDKGAKVEMSHQQAPMEGMELVAVEPAQLAETQSPLVG